MKAMGEFAKQSLTLWLSLCCLIASARLPAGWPAREAQVSVRHLERSLAGLAGRVVDGAEPYFAAEGIVLR